MSSQVDLLDELARVYARAAVDEFLAACCREGLEKKSSETNALIECDGCKLTGESTRAPIGRES
jgi:hypothetical protein